MANKVSKLTITAALPYTNGPLHIGHLAGVYVPADIYARYWRAQGRDVAFICGSDEHGVAISMKARKEGISPKEVIDTYDEIIRNAFRDFGISFDNYSRTSKPIHHHTAQEFFKTLHEKNVFEETTSEQLYDPEAQSFLADRYVTGECPICHHPEAYGDQCEACGSSLNATDLINPKSTLSGARPVVKATKHWFLPLDRYESFLEEWIIQGHKKDWKPNVYGQVKSWVDNGLKARAVTRDLDWGIPVPVENAEGKVLYVWFDAPIGYISSTQEWAARENKNWEDYWKDPQTELVHFIGKDNIVFHCIIFPIMLQAHGDYILPKNVPANEFLNLEGQKISTSKNWAVWLHEYLEDFPEQQDVLRYVLTANAPETKDNDFTWKDFQTRNNSELVAIYGNFVNRVLVLSQKYYQGKVPSKHTLEAVDQNVIRELQAIPEKIGLQLEKYRFREASQSLMQLARMGNKYLADEEPWKLVKTNPERVETIMHIALQVTAALAVLSEPFLPHTAQKLSQMLQLERLQLGWDSISQNTELIPAGHTLGTADLLFQRIEDAAIETQIHKLQNTQSSSMKADTRYEPEKDLINFEQFSALDLRIGEIKAAQRVPKTDKLMQLEVDLGFEQRTIVSGIAQHFTAEELIGKKVSVVVNLAPRKIRGVDSQGMLLLAENPEGELIFVGPEKDLFNGAVIR